MEREVVRIVTPGTVTDEALLEERRDNLLASVCGANGRFGLAWLDLSAGRFSVMELGGLASARSRDRAAASRRITGARRRPTRARAGDPGAAMADCGRPGISTPNRPRVPSPSNSTPAISRVSAAPTSRWRIAAAGALLAYVRETQKAALPHLLSITTEERDAALIMDPRPAAISNSTRASPASPS
jgi:DNA mismatch repair protein MutS